MSELAAEARLVAVDGMDELEELVDSAETLLLELYTDGCTLCQSMEPVLSNVARATDATVVTFNAGDDLRTVDRFDVRSVPTLVLFEDGAVVATLADGFVPTERVVEFVESGGASERAD